MDRLQTDALGRPEEPLRLGRESHTEVMGLWVDAGLRSLRPHGRDAFPAFARALDSGVQAMFGVRDGRRLVGVVLASHDGRKGWINRLAVHPAFRRRGLAQSLVSAAEDWLHQQGIEIIAALIESDNAESLSFFASAGYEVSDDILYASRRAHPDV